jgi:hypothetical protein
MLCVLLTMWVRPQDFDWSQLAERAPLRQGAAA